MPNGRAIISKIRDFTFMRLDLRERRKYVRRRISEIEKLVEPCYAAHEAAWKAAGQDEEARNLASQLYRDETECLFMEMSQLRQERLCAKALLCNVPILDSDYEDTPHCEFRSLTWEAERRIRYEIKLFRRQEVEFWAKLILPTLALLVSVIALWNSFRKH